MALNITDPLYTGIFVRELARKAFDNTSLRKYGAKVIQAVKGKYNYHSLSEQMLLGPYACRPEFGDVNISPRNGEVCHFTYTGEFCHRDLKATFFELDFTKGAAGDSILRVPGFMAALTAFVIDAFRAEVSKAFILGSATSAANYNGNLNFCPDFGLLQKFAASNVIDVENTPITADNVDDELQKILAAYPSYLRFRDTDDSRYLPKFAVSANIAVAWARFLTTNATGYPVFDPSGKPVYNYQGIPMFVINGLPDNTAFLTYPQNIIVVEDDQVDEDRLVIKDKFMSSMDEVIQLRLETKIAADVLVPEEVVYYS